MTIHQPKQRGRWHTCKDVDTHLFCTWLNVTVRHVLICWRYRVNDGRVVTFTQARELTQALRGAKGDEDGWYVYGETLSCAFAMEMWRNRLAFPQHLSWLCATPSLSCLLLFSVCGNAPLLVCVCFFSFRRAHKCKTGSRSLRLCTFTALSTTSSVSSSCQFLLPPFHVFSWNPLR